MGNPETHSVLIRNLLLTESQHDLWQVFYDTYRDAMLRWCAQRGVTHDLAEDIVQSAMTKVFCKLHTYDRSKGRFSIWLKTIVVNEMNDRFRKDAKMPFGQAPGGTTNQQIVNAIAEADEPNDSELALDEESVVAEIFRRTRARVSENTWDIFIRSQLLREDARTIAEDVGIKRASVYQNVSRVTKALKIECESVFG